VRLAQLENGGSVPVPRRLIERVGDFRLWPFAAQNDVRSYVGNWGITGLVMLTVSFVVPDPFQTSIGREVSRSCAGRIDVAS
jgi:hypothetical protein